MESQLAVSAQSELKSFSPQEVERIEAIRSGVQLGDSNAILQFGTGTQAKIAGYADTILAEVRNKDTGAMGESLSGMISCVKELDVGSLSNESPMAKLPVLGGLFSQVRKFLQRYDKVSVQIDRVAQELEKSRMGLMKDVALLDGLYEKNLSHIRELDLHVAAGSRIVDEIRQTAIPQLEAKARASGDPVDSQRLQDANQFVERFEKKVHDLKLSRMVAIQTAPQIRLIQGNNQLLVEKIQSSLLQTLPLWKSQMVLAISLLRQKKALELQNKVTDTTNDLLRANAEMLRQQSVGVARAGERGIVDLETLRKVNEDLLSTLEETVRIQREGRQSRVQAEGELAKIEGQLRSKMLEVSSGSARLVERPSVGELR